MNSPTVPYIMIMFYTITLRNFVVPTLRVVGDPLSGNGCGSPNHILLSFHLCFIY